MSYNFYHRSRLSNAFLCVCQMENIILKNMQKSALISNRIICKKLNLIQSSDGCVLFGIFVIFLYVLFCAYFFCGKQPCLRTFSAYLLFVTFSKISRFNLMKTKLVISGGGHQIFLPQIKKKFFFSFSFTRIESLLLLVSCR